MNINLNIDKQSDEINIENMNIDEETVEELLEE